MNSELTSQNKTHFRFPNIILPVKKILHLDISEERKILCKSHFSDMTNGFAGKKKLVNIPSLQKILQDVQ